MRSHLLSSLTATALLAAACGGNSASSGSMDDAIKTLMAKTEHTDESITVQHVLIAFQGAPRIQGVTRSKDEA